MTQIQLYRKVKSLAWRRSMSESLNDIESEIKSYMLEENSNKIIIAGYKVTLIERNLMLEKLPVIDLNQLKFNYLREKGV
jgi:hypothetical protein